MVSSRQQTEPAAPAATIEVIPLTLHIGAEIRGVTSRDRCPRRNSRKCGMRS